MNCLRSNVVVLHGDAGFHSGLCGEYRKAGSYGGKRRFRFDGTYKGYKTVYLMWSAVENRWVIRGHRDPKLNLPNSIPWVSSKPIIRNGSGSTGPHLVPIGAWMIQNEKESKSAPMLRVVEARSGAMKAGDLDDSVGAPNTQKRTINYETAKWLCTYLGWLGAHQFYMGTWCGGLIVVVVVSCHWLWTTDSR